LQPWGDSQDKFNVFTIEQVEELLKQLLELAKTSGV